MIAEQPDVVVLGSQSILASFEESQLPPQAVYSIEADITFLDDGDDDKSDRVDGAIGELSPFHELHGIYAQGVSITTAVLPRSWRERVVTLQNANTAPGRGLCLEPHDLVISKLIAGRDKDYEFANALLAAGLIDKATLLQRVCEVTETEFRRQRVIDWLNARSSPRRVRLTGSHFRA